MTLPLFTGVPVTARFRPGRELSVTYLQDLSVPTLRQVNRVGSSWSTTPRGCVSTVPSSGAAGPEPEAPEHGHDVVLAESPAQALASLLDQARRLGASGVASVTMRHQDRGGRRHVVISGVAVHEDAPVAGPPFSTHLTPGELDRAAVRGWWPLAAVLVRAWGRQHLPLAAIAEGAPPALRLDPADPPGELRDASAILSVVIGDATGELARAADAPGRFGLLGPLTPAVAAVPCASHAEPGVDLLAEVTSVGSVLVGDGTAGDAAASSSMPSVVPLGEVR